MKELKTVELIVLIRCAHLCNPAEDFIETSDGQDYSVETFVPLAKSELFHRGYVKCDACDDYVTEFCGFPVHWTGSECASKEVHQ